VATAQTLAHAHHMRQEAKLIFKNTTREGSQSEI
jgi:hypothetical protein